MKARINALSILAVWAILSIWILGIAACCLITVPVETSVKAAGTIVDTGVKVVTAPVRWMSRKIADGPEDSKK